MRITSGAFRGRVLKAPPGQDVRPTSDKVRQALFNILFGMGYPDGARVLDGFCGTGALGLEALSRGAAFCLFMDKSATSFQCCKDNVTACKAQERSRILQADAVKPGRAPSDFQADLFFLDPPYRLGLAPLALAALAASGWLAPGAAGAIETETEASAAMPDGFVLEDRRLYGGTCLSLVRYRPNP